MLNKYAFVSPIAIVSSFFPYATLPASVWVRDHPDGDEKSSSYKMFPRLGRKSSVGVMIRVGNAVGVSVGGNHTIVGVTVIAGIGVSMGCIGVGTVVGDSVHADNKYPILINDKNLFILFNKKTHWVKRFCKTLTNKKRIIRKLL